MGSKRLGRRATQSAMHSKARRFVHRQPHSPIGSQLLPS